jgi:deoxycytidine triphosphate deaminase
MKDEPSSSLHPQSRRDRERQRLLALKAKRPSTDPFPGTGVVLSDGIEHYVEEFALIAPFDPKNLKPACYRLTVGDECAVGGQIQVLSDETGKNLIRIPPFEVAIINTSETINMPVFLIGRWNIQVYRAYEGLLWVGGPQVDAGYVGHLFCPIYNLSNITVELKSGEPFAVIDFVKTTDFHPGKSKPYADDGLPTRILFEDYEPEKLKSALAVLTTGRLRGIQERIQKLEDRTQKSTEQLESRFNVFASVTLGAIGVLFAVLALFVTVGDPKTMPLWAFAATIFSFLAFLISVGALKKLF